MFNQLSLRLLAPTLVVSAALLLLGGGAAWSVYSQQQHASRVLLLNLSKVRTSGDLEIAIRSLRNRLREYSHTGDVKFLKAAAVAQLEVQRWVDVDSKLAPAAEEATWVRQIREGYARLDDSLAGFHPATPPSRDAVAPVVQTISDQLLVPAQRLLTLQEDLAKRADEECQQAAQRTVFYLAVLCICGAFLGLAGGAVLVQGVAQNLFDLWEPLRRTAGKLNEVTDVLTPPDQLGLQTMERQALDISTRVTTVVERLQRSEQAALRAEQLAAVGQLGAGLAHELRNPLMAMKVLVQSALCRGGSEHLEDPDLQVMEDEISRLERTIDMFLDFARPPSLRPQPLDLREQIEGVVKLTSHRARQQGVELRCQMPARPACIIGDGTQLRQVWLNLVLNALDATPAGGRVDISLTGGTAADHSAWQITVADSGPGLPGELADRIFEPFVSTKETGMGLGLSISKRIVEAHRGGISAHSGAQGGACFSVALPKRYRRNLAIPLAGCAGLSRD